MPPGGLWAERRLLEIFQRRQRQLRAGALSAGSGVFTRRAEVEARAAFLALPRTIRQLYAHSYFDRLWNICASERVSRYGPSPVQGDLVADPKAGNASAKGVPGEPVRRLDEEEVAATETSAFEVLLPRMGTEAEFPENAAGSVARSYLAYDGLDPTELFLEGSLGERQEIPGTYRPVLSRPRRLRWYVEADSAAPTSSDAPRVTGPRVSGRGALVLDFGLGPGQYATMALREVMRSRRPPGERHVVFSDSESDV